MRTLVVFRYIDKIDKNCNVLENMNPLFPLSSKAADIKYPASDIFYSKESVGDADSVDPDSENVLICWRVIRQSDTVDRVEIARKNCYL